MCACSDEDHFVVAAFGAMPGDPRDLLVAISPVGSATPLLMNGNVPAWTIRTAQGTFTNPPGPDSGAFSAPCAGTGGPNGTLAIDQPRLASLDDAWCASFHLRGGPLNAGQDNCIYFIDKNEQNAFAVSDPFFTSQFPDGAGIVGCDPLGGLETQIVIVTPADETQTNVAYFVGTDVEPAHSCQNLGDLSALRLFAVASPLSGNPTTHFMQLSSQCINRDVPCVPTSATSPEDQTLQTTGARVHSVFWTEEPVPGGTDEFLYVTQGINSPVIVNLGTPQVEQVDRAAIGWYKIRLNGWPGIGASPPAVVSQGVIAAPNAGEAPNEVPVHLFFPYGAVNSDLDFVVVMAQSSETEKASVRLWYRKENGTNSGPPILLKDSVVADVPQEDSCAPWGDYFNIRRDPVDLTLFWATGQIMKTGGDPEDERWTTWNFFVDDP